VLIYLASTYASYENKIIAEHMGEISRSAVTKIKARMNKMLIVDKDLYQELEKMSRLDPV
jgi:hypothetical protein